jgi:hypothetical protein
MTKDKKIPAGWIRWPQAMADFDLASTLAAKIRKQYNVPTIKVDCNKIYVDPIAWDEAVSQHFAKKGTKAK